MPPPPARLPARRPAKAGVDARLEHQAATFTSFLPLAGRKHGLADSTTRLPVTKEARISRPLTCECPRARTFGEFIFFNPPPGPVRTGDSVDPRTSCVRWSAPERQNSAHRDFLLDLPGEPSAKTLSDVAARTRGLSNSLCDQRVDGTVAAPPGLGRRIGEAGSASVRILTGVAHCHAGQFSPFRYAKNCQALIAEIDRVDQ
jgi:hypothetical protein